MVANKQSATTWYPDTGATNHVTADLGNLHLQFDYQGPDSVAVGNGNQLPISKVGSTVIYYTSSNLFFNNILHVLSIRKNLLSVNQFTRENNCYFLFTDTSFFL